MQCPHCQSVTPIERPGRTELGTRRFRCQSCHRECNERTGTPFNRLQYPGEVVCLVVLWRLSYKLSLRDLAEMFLECRFVFSHETVRAWEAIFAPLLTERLCKQRYSQGGRLFLPCWPRRTGKWGKKRKGSVCLLRHWLW